MPVTCHLLHSQQKVQTVGLCFCYHEYANAFFWLHFLTGVDQCFVIKFEIAGVDLSCTEKSEIRFEMRGWGGYVWGNQVCKWLKRQGQVRRKLYSVWDDEEFEITEFNIAGFNCRHLWFLLIIWLEWLWLSPYQYWRNNWMALGNNHVGAISTEIFKYARIYPNFANRPVWFEKIVPVLFSPKRRKKRLDKQAQSSLSPPPHTQNMETLCYTSKNR